MSEVHNIEQSQEDAKSESPKEEVNKTISQEQTAIPNSKSEIQKSETEKMEVHHHPDLHHRKKHWKEYFLEFLMIFLAVTLGFFAENLHEHFTNNEIEKNNIESVVKNLADDTSQLINAIKFNKTRLNGIDSLLSLKKLDIRDSSVKKSIYYYGFLYAGYFLDFISNDATIEQMKTSGSLRLIKKQNIADSILKYEYINKVIKSNEDVLRFEYQKNARNGSKIF